MNNVIDFIAARKRLDDMIYHDVPLDSVIETVVTPRATMIERIMLTLDQEQIGELLTVTLEEMK